MGEKQHYISEFYLRYFSPENKKGLINIIELPDIELKNQSISKRAACQFGYNTIIKEDGKEDNELEKIFGLIEKEVGKILKKLNDKEFNLSQNEYTRLIEFMVFINTNSPASRDSIEYSTDQTNRIVLQMLNYHNPKLFKDKLDELKLPEVLRVKLKEDVYDTSLGSTVSKQEVINLTFSIFSLMITLLNKFYFNLYIISDDSCFITTDRPLVPYIKDWKAHYMPGFGIAEQIFFPLTKKICLVGNKKMQMPNTNTNYVLVNSINHLILAQNSYKYLFLPFTKKEFDDQLLALQEKDIIKKFNTSFQ